ncbi:hypothetical protein OFC62_33715, partial [Escherichia coli]|nr:hypothetical protein [Escherichia coli]
VIENNISRLPTFMGYSLLWQRRHCAYMALQLQLSGERHQLLMLKFHHHATQFLIPLSLLKIQ